MSPPSCALGSQENREPTMECVAALRYAVQFGRLLSDRAWLEFADGLEVGPLLASVSFPFPTPASR
jgi:hypothetical protein